MKDCLYYLNYYSSDENEQLWAWKYQMEDVKYDLFMNVGEEIKLLLWLSSDLLINITKLLSATFMAIF